MVMAEVKWGGRLAIKYQVSMLVSIIKGFSVISSLTTGKCTVDSTFSCSKLWPGALASESSRDVNLEQISHVVQLNW
jgi:hypothetical protein